MRAWGRAIRRTGLPLAFTQGFSPRPRMHFGPALPTCYASTAEYVDVDLTDGVDLADVSAGVSAALPEGMDVLAVGEVDPEAPALQAAVGAVEYVVFLRAPGSTDLAVAVDRLLSAPRMFVTLTRKGRDLEVDLRPAILDLRADATGAPRVSPELSARCPGMPALWCRLATRPRSVRPTEVLHVLGEGFNEHLVHRTAMLLDPLEPEVEPLDRIAAVHS